MKIGNADIEKLYVGETEVPAAYLGSVQVYSQEPPTPTGVPSDEIWYTSTDDTVVQPYETGTSVFGANIVSNTYSDGKGVIEFDGDVTSIGQNAFWNCTSLSSITIPDSVTSIGDYAFDTCQSLSSVIIGSGVTTIGDWVFQSCDPLDSITYNGTMAQWSNITKGIGWNMDVPATVVHCSDGDISI